MITNRHFTQLTILAVAVGCCCSTRAQSLCTADLPHQPPKLETLLGQGVDDIVHVSTRYRGDISDLQRDDWRFFYGTAALTDREKREVFIIRGASELNMAAQLAHETGHARYSPRADYSSRDAFVRSRCRDEGAALTENIILRKAVNLCAGREMGIVTAEPDLMQAKYDELSQSLPIDYEEIGYLFCEKNTNSVTHQNYLGYYGDWWTQNYGRAALAAIPVSGDAVFWSKITLLANRAAQGSHALEEVWPTPQVPLRREESGALASLVGDEASLSRRISVTSSEIRLRSSDHDKVAVASLALSGVCVGLNEVKAHYPDAVATGSPHPGVAGAKATWTAYGDWGGLWFAFPADNPKCLSGVSFHPGEVDASADDRLY